MIQEYSLLGYIYPTIAYATPEAVADATGIKEIVSAILGGKVFLKGLVGVTKKNDICITIDS